LAFEFEQLKRAFAKATVSIEGQIAASKQTGVSAEQMEDFKTSFQHFDQDKNGSLSRLEFKSAMGSMGLIELSFEGTDAKFDALFKQVAGGADSVSFQQYVDYLVKVNAGMLSSPLSLPALQTNLFWPSLSDTISPEQLKDSFATVAGNKDHVTVNDMKVAQLSTELIDYLTSVMPKHASIPDAYDYKAYLSSM